MTLLRLIQGASILAGMTFASLSVYGNPAHADDALYCVTASNGKTACGTLKVVDRNLGSVGVPLVGTLIDAG